VTVSNPEHRGRVDNGYYELDGTHPAIGNFVLMQDGAAMYGGALYYRDGYAPQSAVKPEPVEEPEQAERLPVGTRVVIKRAEGSDLANDHIGKTGVLVGRDHLGSFYDYFVNRDDDPEGTKYPLPVYADEVEVVEPEPPFKVGDTVRVTADTYDIHPTGVLGKVVLAYNYGSFPIDVEFANEKGVYYPYSLDEIEAYTETEQPALAVGDRVVYTPPAEFMGEPGTRWANSGLIGELGTVTEAPRNRGVLVRWDNAGSLRNSIEFVQPAPEYREVTYQPSYTAERAFGLQRTSDGQVAGSLTDATNAEGVARIRDLWSGREDALLYSEKRDIQPL